MKSEYKVNYPPCESHPDKECHQLLLQNNPSQLSMVCSQCVLPPQASQKTINVLLNQGMNRCQANHGRIHMSIEQFRQYLVEVAKRESERLTLEPYSHPEAFDATSFIRNKKQELEHRHSRILEKIKKALSSEKQHYFEQLEVLALAYENQKRQSDKSTENRMRLAEYLNECSGDEELFVTKIFMSSQYGLNALLSQAKHLQVLGRESQSSCPRSSPSLQKINLEKRGQSNSFLNQLQNHFKRVVPVGIPRNSSETRISMNKIPSHHQNRSSEAEQCRAKYSGEVANTERTRRNLSFQNLPNVPRTPKTARQRSGSNDNLVGLKS